MSSNTKQPGYNPVKNNRNYKNLRQQPCRGFPAIFFTCETGREKKCQREALELIHHYYYLSKAGSDSDKDDANENDTKSSHANDEPLSLDEELKMLRKGAAAEEVLNYERNPKRPRYETKGTKSMKSPFVVHDVGMKGIVCVVFSLEGSEVIPYSDIVAALRPKEKNDEDGSDAKVSDDDDAKDSQENSSAGNTIDATRKSPPWDPIETVGVILREVGGSKHNDNAVTDTSSGEANPEAAVSTSPPGSRFILRMIPIQATVSNIYLCVVLSISRVTKLTSIPVMSHQCHASLNEIKAVTKSLLQNYFTSSNLLSTRSNDTITFKIDFKKRNCSHLSRDQIYEALVPMVLGGPATDHDSKQKFAVNLTDPDFSIRIEVCKTFGGISILDRQRLLTLKNFNLAELLQPKSKTDE
jgi:tRNA(Ser,Leu) C12 N-acetylase TAN1